MSTRAKSGFGWLLLYIGGGALFTCVTALATEAASLPEAPAGTPWWSWLIAVFIVSGGTLVSAVFAARRQARKTALEEYQALHDEERKKRREAEDRERACQMRLSAQESLMLREQTRNARYRITIHKMRTFLQTEGVNKNAKKMLSNIGLLIDDDDLGAE